MRTAHNWFADNCEFESGKPYWSISERAIAEIQRDALLEAANVVHAMSRGTYSEERSIAIDNAVSAIIERAREITSHAECESK